MDITKSIPSSEFEIERFGDQNYKFKFVLFNGDGEFLPLRRGAIKSLELQDDLLKWYHFGYADILNPHNVLDKADKVKNKRGINVFNPFRFRNDDLLYLYFFIEPHPPITS